MALAKGGQHWICLSTELRIWSRSSKRQKFNNRPSACPRDDGTTFGDLIRMMPSPARGRLMALSG